MSKHQGLHPRVTSTNSPYVTYAFLTLPLAKSLVESHGMPSNHAQFMFFMLTYFTLFVYFRLSPRHYPSYIRYFFVIFLASVSIVTCFTRIHLEYHYFGQISVGALLGAILGSTWFYIVHVLLTPHFPWIVESKIGRALMLQDFTHIPNVFTFEYNAARSHRTR
ncbi:unnamed protein product [Mesocestoides corti]|uniref:Phosphatidic acid phosphatase type 2/haloperoxidase domain-containing protein n=1 Tax=Mesocestoides corti TaxID=53468 RepID=A0A0R3U8K8_MESCO|nr:unnamed protein product [Mesocestoides corti]